MKAARNITITALLTTVLLAVPTAAQSPDDRITQLETGGVGTDSTRSSQLELARLYVQVGRFYEASKIADLLLAADPEDRDAASIRDEARRGLKAVQQRQIEEAEALERRGNLTSADRLTIANAYFEGGRYLSAAQMFASLPESERTAAVRLRQARAYAWSGRLDDAERLYATLVEQDASLAGEYGRLLSWMGATRPAIDRLRATWERDRSDETLIALANAMSWSGDREGALKMLDERIASGQAGAEVVALRASIVSSPDLKIEQLDRLIAVEPYNLALRTERARLLVDSQRYSEALQAISFIEEHSTRDIEGLDELENRAREGRKQQVAELSTRRAALVDDSASDEEVKKVAQGYVGVDEYDQAIRLYERYLRRNPDDVEARIRYARVLSWDRRYAAAERQYRRILEQHPDRADLQYEYAQVLSYQEDYQPAIQQLRQLTDLSAHPRAHLYTDVSPRANYSLGQIYRWFGWNEHALDAQRSAIGIDGSFAPALQELDLVRHLRPASGLSGTYTFAEDSNDFTMKRLDLEGEKWTSPRTGWNFLLGRHDFERLGNDVQATAFAVGGRYRWEDRWTARARVGINAYNEGIGTRPYWGIGADFLPSIQSRVALDYNHYDLVYDVFTLESLRQDPLEIDDFRAHWDYKTGGNWAYLADASYGVISDDNNRFGAHGLLTYRFLKEPYVALKADGRYLHYDQRTNRYWSPDDYRSLAGVLHVGQNFRERFFWQAELKYGKSWEDDRSSDIRAAEARIIVPVNDALDIVGNYGYGRSGRLDSVFGTGEDLVNYWQRRFYVGIRLKRLFGNDDRRRGDNPYYYDDTRVEPSVLPPFGETR